jgi:hypothetical protein
MSVLTRIELLFPDQTEKNVSWLRISLRKSSNDNPKQDEVHSLINRGNTDCKMYYNLSKNIYRFMGGPSEGSFAAVRDALLYPR